MQRFKLLVVVGVVCIWSGVAYRIFGPAASPPVPSAPEAIPPITEAAVAYELFLDFGADLFRLPEANERSRTAQPDTESFGTLPENRQPAQAVTPPAPTVDHAGLSYIGFVRAEAAEPTALLKYGDLVAHARVGDGIAAYRVEAIGPDSATVVHGPSRERFRLGIQR